MNFELTDPDQASNALLVSSSLRRQRWAILAVGLACSAVLILVLFGAVPGVSNTGGLASSVGVAFGAAFLAAAGIGSWLVWTRIANFHTRRALLTDQGITVEFMNGPSAHLDWTDPGLRFSIGGPEYPSGTSHGTIRWGSGKLGQSATLSGSGRQKLEAEAVSRGFKGQTTFAGKSPNRWATTEYWRL